MEILRIIFFMILSFAGGFGLFAGLKAGRFRRKVQQWPTASISEINTALIEPESAIKESPGDKSISANYSFILNGKRISGDHTDAFELLGHRKTYLKNQAERNRKKLNECHLVYYNPENPEENFLIIPSHGRVLLVIISGILLFLFSFIAFLITLAEQLN